jgi:hypothetical protein
MNPVQAQASQIPAATAEAPFRIPELLAPAGLVHHTHAALADLFQEVVGPKPTQMRRVGGF